MLASNVRMILLMCRLHEHANATQHMVRLGPEAAGHSSAIAQVAVQWTSALQGAGCGGHIHTEASAYETLHRQRCCIFEVWVEALRGTLRAACPPCRHSQTHQFLSRYHCGRWRQSWQWGAAAGAHAAVSGLRHGGQARAGQVELHAGLRPLPRRRAAAAACALQGTAVRGSPHSSHLWNGTDRMHRAAWHLKNAAGLSGSGSD